MKRALYYTLYIVVFDEKRKQYVIIIVHCLKTPSDGNGIVRSTALAIDEKDWIYTPRGIRSSLDPVFRSVEKFVLGAERNSRTAC